MSRCTGHCCRSFTLSIPHAELKANPERVPDGVFVLDMLVPLEPREDGRERFNCRHHNAETGDCRVYDSRPDVCRRHGVTYSCPVSACTLAAPVEKVVVAGGSS